MRIHTLKKNRKHDGQSDYSIQIKLHYINMHEYILFIEGIILDLYDERQSQRKWYYCLEVSSLPIYCIF
jgi:hypothetical protein